MWQHNLSPWTQIEFNEKTPFGASPILGDLVRDGKNTAHCVEVSFVDRGITFDLTVKVKVNIILEDG
jgi:hypothetical protein